MGDWLAQNGEDRIIAEWLAEHHPTLVGRVLDIGAHDGWSLSNTARLLERGWGGVLVEPSPRPLTVLLERWGDRRDITIVAAAIVTDNEPPGMIDWYDCSGDVTAPLGDFYSTSESANLEKWASAVRFRAMVLPSVRLESVLPYLGGWPAHVVSIDTEGNSVDILRALDLSTLGALVVVVEHDDRIPEIAQHCEKHGMRLVHVNAENVLAVRE